MKVRYLSRGLSPPVETSRFGRFQRTGNTAIVYPKNPHFKFPKSRPFSSSFVFCFSPFIAQGRSPKHRRSPPAPIEPLSLRQKPKWRPPSGWWIQHTSSGGTRSLAGSTSPSISTFPRSKRYVVCPWWFNRMFRQMRVSSDVICKRMARWPMGGVLRRHRGRCSVN